MAGLVVEPYWVTAEAACTAWWAWRIAAPATVRPAASVTAAAAAAGAAGEAAGVAGGGGVANAVVAVFNAAP